MNTIAILGAGQMGSGIAHVCALAGFSTLLYDNQAAALPQALQNIAANLARQVKKQSISNAQATAAQANIQTQTAIGSWLSAADFIIEAVSEDRAIKQALYQQVRPYVAADAIFASNTSSYAIGALAAATPNAANFIGMHFMNPVPMMPLVEIITATGTSEHAYQQTQALAQKLGKQTIRAADRPGFITNRVLFPLLNEAAHVLHEGTGNVCDIDNAMKLGMNHPMGPLALADFIGLDTCLAILNVLYEGLQEEKFRPCPLFAELVAAGCLGRKSGVGFYDYRTDTVQPAARFS
ncbi:MAG: 3-hydroxybutyryl-CoA dehydrogenase [Proteobacteria bacterium]|nr:3-hydroxybutyryl-CoA dehydrogenase [Pseudomonadota bacterium]